MAAHLSLTQVAAGPSGGGGEGGVQGSRREPAKQEAAAGLLSRGAAGLFLQLA